MPKIRASNLEEMLDQGFIPVRVASRASGICLKSMYNWIHCGSVVCERRSNIIYISSRSIVIRLNSKILLRKFLGEISQEFGRDRTKELRKMLEIEFKNAQNKA